MPLVTFSPSISPTPGTSHNPRVDVLVADFGDGYTQAAPNGLNHIRDSITLRWDGLTDLQMSELKNFFEERGGYRPFYYQPRGFLAALKWTCREWSISDASPWRIEAKFEQVFSTET